MKSKSTLMVEKERLVRRYALVRDGKPWEPVEDSQLLNHFLADGLKSFYGKSGLVNLLQRSPSSIRTRLWKLASRYTRRDAKEPFEHTPIERDNRKGQKWTASENYLLGIATGTHGIKSRAYTKYYLSRLLQRDKGELREHLQELATKGRVSLFDDYLDVPWLTLVLKANAVLSGSFVKFDEELKRLISEGE